MGLLVWGRQARLAALASTLLGCSQTVEDPLECQSSPIVFGNRTPSSLRLEPEMQAAIVSILYPGGDACTGTLVTGNTIATAAHCILKDRNPLVVITTEHGEAHQLRPHRMLAHPELDLGLLIMDEAEVPSISPIALVAQAVDESWEGSVVEIAGFGTTETDGALLKRFAATLVREVEPESLVVSSDGQNGACVGDSGGPLLGRDDSGRIRVVGILTAGHPSCVGHDRYVRVDAAGPWWEDNIAIEKPLAEGCDGLTTAGSCVRGLAMRCKSGQLRVERCGIGQICGRSANDIFFGCVQTTQDVCGGKGSATTCDGEVLVQCGSNGRESVDCNPCGGPCREVLPGSLATCAQEP